MTTKKEIQSDAYNESFLLSEQLEGYDEFKQGALSTVKQKQLGILEIVPGISMLEIGYGRGEVLRACAQAGAQVSGIDYASTAFDIARQTLAEFPTADLRQGDARQLPFESNSFDRVFAADVIEHMDYADGQSMLKEMSRVLKPGGFMLVHTTPNTVFTRLVYPCIKPVLALVKKDVIRLIDSQLEVMKQLHVQEYSLPLLRKAAREAGLAKAAVWIDSDVIRAGHRITREVSTHWLISFFAAQGKRSLVRFFLGNDLYLKYVK